MSIGWPKLSLGPIGAKTSVLDNIELFENLRAVDITQADNTTAADSTVDECIVLYWL